MQVCIDILAIIKHLLMDVNLDKGDILDVPELFVPRGELVPTIEYLLRCCQFRVGGGGLLGMLVKFVRQ